MVMKVFLTSISICAMISQPLIVNVGNSGRGEPPELEVLDVVSRELVVVDAEDKGLSCFFSKDHSVNKISDFTKFLILCANFSFDTGPSFAFMVMLGWASVRKFSSDGTPQYKIVLGESMGN